MSAWPENGIHYGVPFNIYRSDDITQADTIETARGKAVSKSLIVDFMQDPGTWKRSKAKKQTKAMHKGSLVDCLLLEPDKFESRYSTLPFKDLKTNAAKEWKAEVEAGGVKIVTESELATAQSSCEAIRKNPSAAALLDGAKTAVAFRYSTRHGISSKGMVDVVPQEDDVLADLKKCTQSAMKNGWSLRKYIYEWSLHWQSGSYLDGWNICSGEERTRFKFIFVTDCEPFRSAVIELPMAAILLGAQQYQSGVHRFMDCLERDEWPSQWDGCVELDLPEYAYTE